MRKYQIYYQKTGGIHDLDEDGMKECIKTYKMFKCRDNLWVNGRMDIFLWEKKHDV